MDSVAKHSHTAHFASGDLTRQGVRPVKHLYSGEGISKMPQENLSLDANHVFEYTDTDSHPCHQIWNQNHGGEPRRSLQNMQIPISQRRFLEQCRMLALMQHQQ